MTYTVLFLGLPVVGVWFYYVLLRAMFTARVARPPIVPLFFVFAAYGAVLQFFVSEFCRVWSAMHSLALFGLLFVAVPGLFVQGLWWRRTWALSGYHRATIALSLAFPAALASLIGVSFATGR